MGKRKRRILRNRPGKLGRFMWEFNDLKMNHRRRVLVALDRYRQARLECQESEDSAWTSGC